MKFKSGDEFVKNLVTAYCPEPTVSSTIRLDTYYKKAHSMFHQALDFVKQGNDARSYIELMRYCQLITTLTTHNNYNLKQYEKDKNINKRRLNNAITKLEELKPKLIESYNTEIKRERQASNNASSVVPSAPSAPDLEEEKEDNNAKQTTLEEEKQQQKQSDNRWNNLKIESSPFYAADQQTEYDKKSNASTSKLDAIFKKPPASLTPIYITDNLVSGFMEYAKLNTSRDIETCAVLTGKYLHTEDAYLVSYVIIPKQKGSANTVQTLCEEELIGVQEKYGVVTIGWIHSHPSQTCFLSSVDMHCQLSYQIMMP
eukprot:90153_1